MANAKPKNYSDVTPRGVAIYPRLNTPDTKYNASGVFSTKMKFSCADAAPLMEAIEKAAEAAVELAKIELEEKIETSKGKDLVKAKAALEKLEAGPLPFEPDYDDEGNETGDYIFSFKTNATYKDRKTGKVVSKEVPMFDSKGTELVGKKKPNVWGGSVLKIDFTAAPYYNAATNTAGVSLRINAVQVIELVTGGGGAKNRFGVEEGGYEASEVEEDSEEQGGSDSQHDGDDSTGNDEDF